MLVVSLYKSSDTGKFVAGPSACCCQSGYKVLIYRSLFSGLHRLCVDVVLHDVQVSYSCGQCEGC